MTERRSLLHGFRSMLVADVLRLVSRGAVILLLTRVLLSPEGYGLLSLALAVLGMAILFSNFGLPKSVARYVTEHVETSPGQVPHLLRTGFLVNAVSIGLVCLGLVVARGRIAAVLDEVALASLLLVGAGFVVARSLEKHLFALFQAFNAVQWSALVKTVDAVVQPVFIVVFVLAGSGVVGALAGYVAGAAVATAVGMTVLYLRFYRDFERAPTFDRDLPGRVLRYSVPLTASGVANVFDKRADIILVGYFLDPAAVAYYTLAKQVSEFVMTPASSLGFTISPQFGTQKANDELARAADLYETAFVYTTAIYVPAAVGMILVADPAVTFVFGQEYGGAAPVVQVFGVYSLLLALDKITNDGLDYLGRAKARATAKGVTSFANVGLNLVLIPVYGVTGAAVATVVTVGALVGVELYVVANELPLSVPRLARTVSLVLGVTAGMTLAVLVLLPYVTGLPSLAGVVLAGVAVWAVLASASGLVDLREVRGLVA